MKDFQDDLNELIQLARVELDSCNTAHTPNLCKAKVTGYDELLDKVTNRMIKQGISAGTAIIDIERELSNNDTELL